MIAILTAALTVLVALSLASHSPGDADNFVGPTGDTIASALTTAFGFGAWWLVVELALATVRLVRGVSSRLGAATVGATLVVLFVGCALLQLAWGAADDPGVPLAGGVVGELFGEVLRAVLGTAGAWVVCVSILLVTLVLRTPVSVLSLVRGGVRTTVRAARRVGTGLAALWSAWRQAKRIEREARERERERTAPRIVTAEGTALEEDVEPPAQPRARDDVAPPRSPVVRHGSRRRLDAPAAIDEFDETTTSASSSADADAPDAGGSSCTVPADAPRATRSSSVEAASGQTAESVRPTVRAVAPRARRRAEIDAPRIVQSAARADADPALRDGDSRRTATDGGTSAPYTLPPTSLLRPAPPSALRLDAERLRENAQRLVEKLAAFQVRGRVDEIHPGPVVTMYEFEPESGTKISKIAGLADDLTMALAAQKVRIVAPIPGKARVGFELPNETRETVYLRELLEDPRWIHLDAALPVAFGKDIAGKPVYGDLARMPHLLVAGATGAGKSVGLNVMLVSLLAKKTPEQVRLLMIDPKVVELAVFDGIPHMLLPVVTDMKKASRALKWAVDEMERRYQLFAEAGSRNIESYNEKVRRVLAGELDPARLGGTAAADASSPPTPLPYVVVVVDEFADLMMVAAKDVEACVARLAQKARAAGIHVILATQRPSVDVITGMIKANFPARIAFKVAQREDSKTILGRSGAEHLLGRGDMLMLPPGSSDLRRVHSAFVSEEEVAAICDHLRAQGRPVYDEQILQPREDEAEQADASDAGAGRDDDPLYDRAVAVVAAAGYCSISHIQRQLGVGYNKAAKLVERMEREGVVGPASAKAGGRREVLVRPL
ncbi:MAG: DNA translocase FtsK [Myxococcales bacterium]|nr:DNA translocase FtsK [Myxococcales bacterium]